MPVSGPGTVAGTTKIYRLLAFEALEGSVHAKSVFYFWAKFIIYF